MADQRYGPMSGFDSGIHCSHGVASCDPCLDRLSGEQRAAAEQLAAAHARVAGLEAAVNRALENEVGGDGPLTPEAAEGRERWWQAFSCLKPTFTISPPGGGKPSLDKPQELAELLASAVHIEIAYRVQFANDALDAAREAGYLTAQRAGDKP